MMTRALFLLCAQALSGCRPAPEPPAYFLTQTVEREGVTVTRTYSGLTLPAGPLFERDISDLATNEP